MRAFVAPKMSHEFFLVDELVSDFIYDHLAMNPDEWRRMVKKLV